MTLDGHKGKVGRRRESHGGGLLRSEGAPVFFFRGGKKKMKEAQDQNQNQKMKFSGGYIALGDSMSIDLYPRVDALERFGNHLVGAKVGAVSLLYENHSQLWPEWSGLDLKSYWESRGSYPHFHDYAEDGATTETLLHHQLPLLPPPGVAGGNRLFTITIGGNDLLHAALGRKELAERLLNKAILHLYQSVIQIAATNPFATILISDVYDPTDGTGQLRMIGGEWDFREKLSLLHHWNKEVRELVRVLQRDRVGKGASWTPRVILIETYRHFQLHGVGYGGVDAQNHFWYWPPSMIEPGMKGASELRRLWWEALEIDEAPLRKARRDRMEKEEKEEAHS